MGEPETLLPQSASDGASVIGSAWQLLDTIERRVRLFDRGNVRRGRDHVRVGDHALIDDYCQDQCGHMLNPHRPPPWDEARRASKLAIVLSRDDDDGRALIYAWVELSNLCHAHAYQLWTAGPPRADHSCDA